MSNQPPTLAEMKHAMNEEVFPPTISQMFESLSDEETLAHFGVKGMKWGVRRTDAELGKESKNRSTTSKVANSIKDKSKAAIQKLRQSRMKAGEAAVVDDGDGPKVVIKTKNGELKETRLSADTESFMRTTAKESHEMSTREMKEAINRMQAIEAYNKIVNPSSDPNAALRQKTEAMELQLRYKEAYLKTNPPKPGALTKVAGLVGTAAPMFKQFKEMDQATGGALGRGLKSGLDSLKEQSNSSPKFKEPKKSRSEKKSEKTGSNFDPFSQNTKRKKNRDTVYNITDVGANKPYYPDPSIPQLGGGR